METYDKDASTQSEEEARVPSELLALQIEQKKLEIALAKDRIRTNEVKRKHYEAKMQKNFVHQSTHTERERAKTFWKVLKTLVFVAITAWIFQLYLWSFFAMDRSLLDRFMALSNNNSLEGNCTPPQAPIPKPSPPIPSPPSTELKPEANPYLSQWFKEQALFLFDKSKEHLSDATKKAQVYLASLDPSAFSGWFTSALSNSKLALGSLILVALASVVRLLKMYARTLQEVFICSLTPLCSPAWTIGVIVSGFLSLGHREGLIALTLILLFETVLIYILLRTGFIFDEARMDFLLLRRVEVPLFFTAFVALSTGLTVGVIFG